MRQRKTRSMEHLLLPILGAILLALLLAVLFFLFHEEETSVERGSHEETASQPLRETVTESSPAHRRFRMVVGGDVLLHDNMLEAACASRDDYSDFSFLFRQTTAIFQQYDLPILNMEGTLGDPPFRAYPLFHAPRKVAYDLHKAGIKMATTANNHMLDAGAEGIFSTYRALETNYIVPIGSSLQADQPTWSIQQIQGIPVGFSAFTYETVRQEGQVAINGLLLPQEAENCIDHFSYEPGLFEASLEALQARERQMREVGAKFTVFFLHWGTEYDVEPSSYQREMAQALTDAGTDLIIGMGPHVVQPVSTLTSRNGAHQSLCYWSLGNFVSAQYFTTGDSNGHAEDGLLALVEVEEEEGMGRIVKAGYTPLYCYKPALNGGAASVAIPLGRGLADPTLVDGHRDLLEASAARTQALMAKNQVHSLNFAGYPDGILP